MNVTIVWMANIVECESSVKLWSVNSYLNVAIVYMWQYCDWWIMWMLCECNSDISLNGDKLSECDNSIINEYLSGAI